MQTNSWQSGFTWNNNMTPAFAATNGSPSLTSSTLVNPQICPKVASGTDAVVTNNSDVVTSPGKHFVNSPGKIMFFGDSINPILTFDYIFDNAGQIHLSGLYPGATGSGVHWQIDYDNEYGSLPDTGLSIGQSNRDTQLNYNWACTLTPGTVNTTIAANIATGTHTVTPASMTAISNGQTLYVYNSNLTNIERVVVSNVTGSTFDATFGSSKTGHGIIVGDATGITLDRAWNGPNNSGANINTTIASSITAGLHTVTPASMKGIINGGTVKVQNNNFTNVEVVTVSNVTGTTFDATFTTTHTSGSLVTWSGAYGWKAALGGVGITGRGQQPYVLGIKTLQMSLGGKMPGALGTNYSTLATNAATWIKNYGVDPVSGGLYYGRTIQMCEPVFADSSQPQNFPFGTRNPECSYNGSNASKPIARALVAEAQNAARVSFQADRSSANRAFWDTVYNNQWGAAGMTDPAFYTDGITTSNIDSASLAGGKWTGFFFGIGMSHQWPAVRLGGVAPAVNRNLYIAFNLGAVPNSLSINVLETAPSGKLTTTSCSSSPCAVTADARQGAHLVTIQYIGAASKVLAQSSQNIPVAVQ